MKRRPSWLRSKRRRSQRRIGGGLARFNQLRFEPLEQRCLLTASVVINEFSATGGAGLLDGDGDDSDWIELFNPTPDTVDLTGWHLTDDADSLDQWQFPAVSVEAGDYLVVFASGKDQIDPAAPLHTNFRLSGSGEYLALVEADAATVVDAFGPTYPLQHDGASYGVRQESTSLVSPGEPLGYHVPTIDDAAIGTAWSDRPYDDSDWARHQLAQPVLITEVGTGGVDFVEIQNVQSTAATTDGWVVAANDASGGDINDVHATVWGLPTSIAAGDVLYRTDQVGDEYWGEDLWWATDGPGWVMLLDDAGKVADFVVWGYTPLDVASMDVSIGGTNVTASGVWSGSTVPAATSETETLQRGGTADNNTAGNFQLVTPESKGTTNTGLVLPFPDTLGQNLVTGIGYDLSSSGFDVTFFQANVAVSNLTIAEQVIADPAKKTSLTTETAEVINYYNSGGVGRFAPDNPFPSTTIGVDANNFVLLATATVMVPEAGPWTFGVNSDDGFGLELTGPGGPYNASYPGARGANDTLAVFDLPSAGIYDLRLVTFEGGGGSSAELFAAEGSHAAFDAGAFHLVGDTTAGGLSVDGVGSLVATNVEAEMRGTNASLYVRIPFDVEDPSAVEAMQLAMQYDDGFVAYLNGQQIGSRNAPAAPHWASVATAERVTSAPLYPEPINVTSALDALTVGTNVLALHGLNFAPDDDDFLLLPELIATTSQPDELRYFHEPTPGGPNRTSVLDFVVEPTHSEAHGFHDASFVLELQTETADATIRYTVDGTSPTETTGTVYTGPFVVDQTQVIRAGAFLTGWEPSSIATQTYLFLADILTQSADGTPPTGWPAGPVNGQQLDYGMDPTIVGDATWGPLVEPALEAIPSMLITVDPADLFDPATGIYVNATLRGVAWERPGALELVSADGSEDFSVDMGFRIRGGYSRSDNNPKHSWRLFFRGEYGDSTLDYPLFGDEGVDRFQKVDFRTAQNYSWSFGGDAKNAMCREVFSRDTQAEMGWQYTRSRYYHVYINGQYWGMYQTQERSEAAFGESYFGGERENFDTVKCGGNSISYQTEATDGNLDAWRELWDLGKLGFGDHANYMKAQGLDPDGSRNPSYPVLLDVDNLIDYMIIILYTGNRDAPISKFLGNNRTNNWYGIRDRTGDKGFQFFAHDSEHTLLVADLNENRNGPWPAGDTFNYSNPQWMHQELMAHPEYLIRFADRIQEIFFNDGLLTPAKASERFLARATQIEDAIVAESARWGDAKREPPRTKANWDAIIQSTVDNYLALRTDVVVNQFRNTTLRDGSSAPLYPLVNAPAFSQHGGQVPLDEEIFVTAALGTIYYTTDGSDPRLEGGAISPIAQTLPQGTTETLVAKGATWKYLDDGSDAQTAWRAPAFDDAAWAAGPAQLGYGDGDEQTVVSYGGVGSNKHITTYFRHSFEVPTLGNVDGLMLDLLRDDGAVVYLNGVELPRGNMPAGTINYQTRAAAVVGGANESAFFPINVDPALLVQGTNVLAVELHQISPTSSDLGFDLELRVIRDTPSLTIDASKTITARALDGTTWSARNAADFFVNQAASADNLAIVEIHYNPHAPSAVEQAIDPLWTNDSFEFLELLNTSDQSIDLDGVRFTDGVAFDFTGSSVSPLGPGERTVVVIDRSAFETRYGMGIVLAGEYTGNLQNSGETLTLVDRFDATIASIPYEDSGVWPGRADGGGSSLVVVDPLEPANIQDNWRSSVEYGGTPGDAGLGDFHDVLVNEIVASPSTPGGDWIELYNTTGAPVDIGGWYLSDSNSPYEKFQIPADTILPAGGFLVFDESDFNATGGVGATDFALDPDGEEVWLLEADALGQLVRFADHVEFGTSPIDASWGRSPDGSDTWGLLQASTPGTPNVGWRVGNVVINELHVAPNIKTEPLEFVELFNAGDMPVDLSGWSFTSAIDYTFAPGTMLAPGAYLVVAQDPGALSAKYGAAALGPFAGRLANEGESVVLRDEAGIKQDEVDYQMGYPWPTVGQAPGPSMELVNPSLANQRGGSWRSSTVVPLSSETLVDSGSTWRYLPGTQPPAGASGEWRDVAYDDLTWTSAPGPFGYGEPLVVTTLGSMQGGYTSVYLRDSFTVADPTAFDGLRLEALYDDGVNVWINGTHVIGLNVPGDELPHTATASTGIEGGEYIDYALPDPSVYLRPGTNVVAVQWLNVAVDDDDAQFDARLIGTFSGSNGATPGRINSVFAPNAPPVTRQVDHSPKMPASNDAVTITIKATDSDGVDSVALEYQLVEPGDYITLDDPRYATDWTSVAMLDDGTAGDETAGDDLYTVVLPGSLATNRRLVRYRIQATDTLGESVTVPYDDDPQPNFAYYVYDGVPGWVGSAQPGVEAETVYGASQLDTIPVYQLLTRREDRLTALTVPYRTGEVDQELPIGSADYYRGSDYRWEGALVYDGEVYDHIGYRARGGVWRYAMGKNMWKFDFLRGHDFQATDEAGEPYDTSWDKLNFSAIIQQGNFQQRGEQGLFESVGFALHEMAGNPAPKTHYVHFRVVDDDSPAGPDQFSTDFQGLYLVVEQLDGNFLDEHDLPDGNLYKMEGGTGTLNNQGPTQPNDRSDLNTFINTYKNGSPDAAWWEANLDLEQYYSFRAIAIAIHDYDIHAGKNYFYYHDPVTDKWSVINWDLDLTWTTTYNGGGGRGPLNDYVLSAQFPQFRIGYNNRVRELVDLLFNVEQTGLLMDQSVAPVHTPGVPSLIDADAAMWDYNPILVSSYVDSRKAKNGRFYERSATDDFAGMIELLKNYVQQKGDTYLAGGVFDPKIPSDEGQQPTTPTLQYNGPLDYPADLLEFQTSAFAGGNGQFASMEWRVARVTDPTDPAFDPTQPVHYEIDSVWESGPLTTFADTITVPGTSLEVGATYRVRVRIEDTAGRASHWSDPIQFVAGMPAATMLDSLRISEIMYHPIDPTAEELAGDPSLESDDFEFLELTNIGTEPLDLTGATFLDGLTYTFDDYVLQPNEYVVIVRNETAFTMRYGSGLPVAGQYTGRLQDNGEQIILADPFDRIILDFEYNDSGSWPGRADGGASSLEVIDPVGLVVVDGLSAMSDGDTWRSSTEFGGTPGGPGMGPVVDVVINEVLAHTDAPQSDSIELHNATSMPIDVGGWYISDSSPTYHKFRVPDGTVIPGLGYVVFDEGDFNASGGIAPADFGLDGAHGDDVWLLEAEPNGNLTRFVDHVDFDASANGESFGRWPNAIGGLYPMLDVTFGQTNSGPRVGPLVISEVMYAPPDPLDGTDPDDLEFVEIHNPTTSTVSLENWAIAGGVDMAFDPGRSMMAGEVLVVISFDPDDPVNVDRVANFRAAYGIDTSVVLVGGYSGRLDNGGERFRLLRPDEPPSEEPDYYPLLLEDEVDYDDVAPWPVEPDGLGQTLTRMTLDGWGHASETFEAREPTPGTVDFAPASTLDVDGDGEARALKDGIIILRYLFGVRGQPMVEGLLGSGAMRTDPTEMVEYLDGASSTMLDVDADGSSRALKDGIIILRYLFGVRGQPMIEGLLGSGATRTDANEIFAFLEGYRPPTIPSSPPNATDTTSLAADTTSAAADTLLISEFMAVNSDTLADVDGDFNDWIEIYNPGDVAIDLDGWHLTDDETDLVKWSFPSVTIPAGEYLVVFASSKNRRDPVGELHTSFKLSGDGEYLGLIHPDGLTVAHEFAPVFPPQVADISYGPVDLTEQVVSLVTADHRVSYHVPQASDDPAAWTTVDFDDSAWIDSVPVDSIGLVVTEVSNDTTRFVEIENVSDAALDTSAWTVWVNDASADDINAATSTAWDLPASIAPGEILYRTDDPADAYWGSPIAWDVDGPGWVMIVDEVGDVVDVAVWGYSSDQIAGASIDVGGFVGIGLGERWHGDGAPTGSTDPGASIGFTAFNDQTTGTGTHANATSFSTNTTPAGLLRDIGDGTDTGVTLTTSQSGVIYQAGATLPAVGTDAHAMFNGFVDLGAGTATSLEIVGADYYTHRFTDLDTGDEVTYDVGGTAVRGVSNYTNRWTLVTLTGADSATASHSAGLGVVQVSPTQAALWTGHNSAANQGFVVRWTDIDPGLDGEFSIVSTQYKGATPGVGTGTADGSKGYGLTAIRFEEIRPSGPLAWLRREGNVDTNTTDDFQRVRASDLGLENPELTLPFATSVPALAGLGFHASQPEFAAEIRTDVGGAMQGVNASIWSRFEFNVADLGNVDSLMLRMKYDDGFVAYLNGTLIASNNAPATHAYDMAATAPHPDAQAVLFEEFDVTEHLGLIVEGVNVLAVWGLNVDAADADLLLVPELVTVSALGPPQYMITPTPSAENVPGVFGMVDDTAFSVDRGFHDQPFDVAITTDTAGAEIRYTLDGSEPTATHGTVYADPVHIDGQTVLRAAAFVPGYLPSNVDTHSYIFVEDVIRQDVQATLDAGLPTAWGSTTANYGIDPDVVGTFDPVTGAPNGDDRFGGIYADTIRDDLKAIPTMSIVLNVDDMFGSNGIYSNTTLHGIAWERPTSVELLYPDGSEGFQVDAGIRIQGGYFRRPGATPKHSLRLLFKDDYGPSKLVFPLFGGDSVGRFDTLTLRAGANDGYSWNAAKNTEQYTRDQFGRSLQRATGNPGSRGTFVHLYINGIYWGLYNPVERPDHSFSSSYVGGDKEDWDSLNAGTPTNGDKVAWNAMLTKSQQAATSNDAFRELQGQDPDGTRNPAIPHLMDVTNYIDYLSINQWGGNWDWPGKNWWAGRDRTDASTGYKFYAWDFENTMGNNRARSPLNANAVTKTYTSVGAFHASLKQNAEYRMLFADRVHRLYFNDGILMADNLVARYSDVVDTVERAIVGESARWGDQHYSTPLTLLQWTNERNWLLNTYLPQRSAIVMNQLIGASLYPATVAPAFEIDGTSQHGGIVLSGSMLTMGAPAGTIYYTLDGTDPREFGGAISPDALVYNPGGVEQPVAITGSAHVMSRAMDGGEWSALNEAEFYVSPATIGNVAITELNYHPLDPTPEELAVDPLFVASDFEFVELVNLSDQPIDLTDVRFTEGIAFDFSTSESLMVAPGGYVVIVSNEAAFAARYGTVSAVVGQYTGHLNDGGEQIVLLDALGDTIHDFEYDDSNAWPGRADGNGSSLEVIDPVADYIDADNWRSSAEYGGTPGGAGMGRVVDVVINEVLAHTDLPQTDSIELYNVTAAPIDLGGWYISDASPTYQKFRIPDGTVIAGHGYVVFDEGDFNASGGVAPNDFALGSAHGDDVWLLAADAQGRLTRFVDHVDFKASANGESFGRWPDENGVLYPMTERTFGAVNSGPRVGPLVISEVMYAPPDPLDGTDPDDLEFIEIHNPTASSVSLDNWAIAGGIDRPFDLGRVMEPGDALVVLSFDPDDPLNVDRVARFRAEYGIDTSVVLVGGYSGQLGNGGERVRLLRPDEPPLEEPDYYPLLLEDEIDYDDVAPWPVDADGLGQSLTRVTLDGWGHSADTFEGMTPTPGTVDFAPTFTLDVDGDGEARALKDGIIVLRYLFGVRGTPMIEGLLGAGATRTDPAEMVQYLDAARPTMLDVDADGDARALKDGIIILRYLFGVRDAPMIAGLLGTGATRTDPVEITSHLDAHLPPPAAAAVISSSSASIDGASSPTISASMTVQSVDSVAKTPWWDGRTAWSADRADGSTMASRRKAVDLLMQLTEEDEAW